jgi:hypothetical protein
MLSLLHIQIIIDLFIFVTILLLLRRFGRNMPKIDLTVQETLVSNLKKLLADTQESTNLFLEAVEDNKKALNTLAVQLDNKEKKLANLIKEADAVIKKRDSATSVSGPSSPEGKYDDVIRMVQQGLSRDEISRQSGVPEGEINLILDLEQTKGRPAR